MGWPRRRSGVIAWAICSDFGFQAVESLVGVDVIRLPGRVVLLEDVVDEVSDNDLGVLNELMGLDMGTILSVGWGMREM